MAFCLTINCAIAANAPQEQARRSFLRGDVLEIDLRDAGKLNEYLGPGEDQRVRYLRLSGVINGDDIKFIKRLCERSKAVDENERRVDNYIDLEIDRARIVSGGSSSYRTERDVISNSMFSGCTHLRYVSLPRDLRKIGNYAFSGCSNLEEVRFVGRNGVREIGNNAFYNCYDLKRINLPEGLEVIGDRCFASCNSLRRIELPQSLLEIGEEAFCDVPLSDVRLPDGLLAIGKNAFRGTNVSSLWLPRDVKVEDDAFGKMPKLREFVVERGSRNYSALDGVLYDASGAVLICCPITMKGNFAVPAGVVDLCPAAFAGCASLSTVSLPLSLTSIGDNAFDGCASLGNVIVPASVRSMGNEVFANCKNLTSATIDAHIATLPTKTFEYCGALKAVALPSNLETIAEKAFNECKALTGIDWGNSLRSIKKEAFKKCGFVQLEIPDGVVSIGENAFRDCKSMRSIILPASLVVVEKELFRGCEKLEIVTLPARATTIGENAFRDCKALPAIELNEGLTTINNNAFRGTSLTKLVLPSTLQHIGDKIVEKCKMTGITCLATNPPELKKVSEKKTPLFVPAQSVEAYRNAKSWKEFKNILPIE